MASTFTIKYDITNVSLLYFRNKTLAFQAE